jgi:MoxR-like ATPase
METILMTPPTAAEPLPPAAPEHRVAANPVSAVEIAAAIHRLEENIGQVVRGKPEVIRLATVCLLARGHMLVQDVPGVGKTTLAQALARSLGLGFQRIQFTSDLLPSDIVGVSIFNQQTQAFEFVPGPLFGHVVLADEINRATPKTQSALLEAMSERKVSVDRKRYALPQPFLVLATQNPLEYHGTFPLPESQLDRFLMSLSLGYPPRDDERGLLLEGGVEERLEHLPAVLDRVQLLDLQGAVDRVKVTEKLADYLIALAEATRADAELLLGVSTRGLQGLYRASQALALCEGRAFVLPDDVQRLAPSVLGHRVILKRGGGDLGTARRAIERIVAATAVPV